MDWLPNALGEKLVSSTEAEVVALAMHMCQFPPLSHFMKNLRTILRAVDMFGFVLFFNLLLGKYSL